MKYVEATQFSRIEYEQILQSDLVRVSPTDAGPMLTVLGERTPKVFGMEMYFQQVQDPKSTVNVTMGGTKNVRTIRVMKGDDGTDSFKLEFTLLKSERMLNEEKQKVADEKRRKEEQERREKEAAEKKAKFEAKKKDKQSKGQRHNNGQRNRSGGPQQRQGGRPAK